MKTLIILTAIEDKLEYLPSVRADIVLYVGEMNLNEEDDTPANFICFNGKLTEEQKEHLVNHVYDEYDNEVTIVFFELKGEPYMPDDYTLVIRSENDTKRNSIMDNSSCNSAISLLHRFTITRWRNVRSNINNSTSAI